MILVVYMILGLASIGSIVINQCTINIIDNMFIINITCVLLILVVNLNLDAVTKVSRQCV